MLREVYRGAITKIWIFVWHTKFKEGKEHVEDDPRSRKATTSRMNKNLEHVTKKVSHDCHLTVRIIADEMSMNSEIVRTIVRKVQGITKIQTKYVSRLLNDEQRNVMHKCVKTS